MDRIGEILKTFVVVCFALLLWVGCASAATLVVSKTSPACTTGDFYCDAIQEAMDIAKNGNTIIVCPGTYRENIEVNKSISIQSYAGSSKTIIEAKYTPKNIDEAMSAKANYSVFNISANHVKIRGFTIKGGCPGIFLSGVNYCEIINNSLVGIPMYCKGIWLRESYNNAILNNVIKSGGLGLYTSNNNTLTENIISNSDDAIWMNFSSNNVIRNNFIKSNDNHGVYLSNCYSNIIEENIVSDNEGDGVDLNNGSFNIIRNNTINSNYCGIHLSSSNNNTLEENAVLENTEIGVYLTESHGNTIKNNEVKSNDKSGIELMRSRNNIMEKNTALDNLEGIELRWDSNNNTIKDNVLKANSVQGIYISSDKNIIERNIVSHNFYGIHIDSGNVNNIIKNNIVKSNSEFGILLTINSNNNYIEGNIASDNDVGVDLSDSYRNIIRNNIIISNVENGVGLSSSTYNLIENNNISKNRHYGISISQHYDKDFKETSIENLIYHNNIIDNHFWGGFKGYHPQVQEYFYRRVNRWYDPTLLEGNYWSDYHGVDDGSGRGKHVINGDGIGDTKIPHPDFGNDFYPFMNKSGWLTLLVSPEYWNFGSVYQGDFKPQKTFTIQNMGESNLTILNITSDDDVAITGIEIPATIPAGTSKSFNVTIDTKNLEGDILKTLEIVSSDRITPNKTILMYGFVKVYTPNVRIGKTEFESRVIQGQINLFQISVNNSGVANETNISVNLKEGDTEVSEEIEELGKNETKTVTFKWDTTKASLGIHEIKIEVISDKGELLDSLEVRVYVLPTTKASTFIVTNLKRMAEKWGNDSVSELEEKLIDLSFHPSVNGIIVRVENGTNCSKMYEAWDRDNTPEKANEIAKAIKCLIDSKLKEYPNIEYLVVVGDDRIIPFYRIKDNTKKSHIGPDWKDESDYFKESCISDRSAVGLALSQGYYFTDDFYADFKQERLPINVHVPEKPSGRLVESPEEIISLIDTFLTTYDVHPKSIFVTGCGFMSDGCMSSVHAWEKIRKPIFMVNSPNEVNYNSSEEIKDEILNASNNIMAIFQHADYSGFTNIPGGKNVSDPCDLTASVVSNSTRIEGAIVYAMSCHSGLNVPPEESNSLDLVQSFVRKGVLAYVAPTGYGMGGLVTVAGHEKLLKYFTERLCNGKEVGDALISAKRDYYLNNFHMDYLDEKVVSSTVLYGLPMYRLSKETGAGEERVQIMGTTQNGEMQKMQMEELEVYTLTLRPKLKPEENSSESGKPILPMTTWPYVMDKNKIHGITLDSAEYDFAEDVIRCIETFALSDDTKAQDYESKDWYPSQFFKINTVGEMQKMVVVTGQFKMKYQVSLTAYNGSERQFRELSFDIYLSPIKAEEEKPVINSVERPKKGNATTVTINATDNSSGILKIIVTYTDRNSSNGEWVSMEAEKDAQKPNEYMCELKGDVEFFVQAVDIYGNVAFDDNDGEYYPKKEENLPGQP